MTPAAPQEPTPPIASPLDLRVRAEMVRTAYRDSLYGAPFGIVVLLLFSFAVWPGFPARTIWTWAILTLACNSLRLLMRWRYLRRPVLIEHTGMWSHWFVAVSAATGLSWGVGAWLFYTPHESIYRVMVVLVLAGLTTGASRLLAPIVAANLSYVYLSIGPLMLRLLLNADTRSFVLGTMCLLYLGYMSLAARQQAETLRRTIRLGHENADLVESLCAAKELAEKSIRDLSAEIARREIVESELRITGERAFAASRAKSEFLATMSHEIRTPMNGIIGMLRIVRDTPLSQVQREQIETAALSADTLLDLLNNILDFSKIEAGRLELENIRFSPATIARGVVDVLTSRAKAKGLELTLELDPRLPAVLIGDPTRLRQVLFNLVGNAIKFTHRGRVAVKVVVGAADGAAWPVTFSVADSGIGMEAAALERIFSPFTQADSSMSRRFGGSGLGLAISQKLVEAMGAKISIQSEPGRGSVFEFTLRLPAAKTTESPTDGSTPAGDFVLPKLRGRILVVEDDRVNQRVIKHFLTKMGLESGLAEDGQTAVEVALDGTWDAVLMDCQLPGLDGLEATRQIRARRPDAVLPIIALTANASTQDRANCLAAGMDDFLTKPLRVELLAAALQQRLPAISRPPAAVRPVQE